MIFTGSFVLSPALKNYWKREFWEGNFDFEKNLTIIDKSIYFFKLLRMGNTDTPEMNILIPGRHHLTTTYWEHYIEKALARDLCQTLSVENAPLKFPAGVKATNVIFAITSANHKGTKRNPLDLSKRTMLLDRFGQTLPVDTFQYSIDDILPSPHFAEYIIKKIGNESQGRFDLTPENTVVLSSTPSIIKQFQAR
jgi:hypothetical protein